jgi:hypothetical protein
MLTHKFATELQHHLDQLREESAARGGPSPDQILLLFTDLDDYPEIDAHPDLNFLIGHVRGVADALELPIDDFIDWLDRLQE